ncbi:hypothetical protein MAMC_01627 [Methylacidimicrobium cyclopophantes]|uniref:Glutamine amidotransferase domain-containing protein n=1 Tax=Methylacidimicrobium cyclopophantes TaxID=1041766 RepID=A0A5E6MEE0_9BACT|nr:glutamine amidotransferase [Methylacidimicrobium cyclopophantes]VVM07465.1 hypothetical protein MAMC_01627 [Methylacidimicrobium cyclopophantes]
MPKAIAVSHLPFEDLGSLEALLREEGLLVETIEAPIGRLWEVDPCKAELWIVLGGPIGVYERASYPFLEVEIELLRRRLDARLPTIGICLGAQLMAAALGARVYPGGRGKELGWGRIEPGVDAPSAPWLAPLLSPEVSVLHWHGDTFDLPSGAKHLAATALYPNQAFALGAHALALQFHAEVSAEGLERWYVGHASELAASRVDVPALRAEGQRRAPLLERAAREFWQGWLRYAGLAAFR